MAERHVVGAPVPGLAVVVAEVGDALTLGVGVTMVVDEGDPAVGYLCALAVAFAKGEHRLSFPTERRAGVLPGHPTVVRVQEANRLVPPLPAAKAKNLFIRNKKGRRHFLVVVGYEKAVDLKALSKVLNAGGLSFASPKRLQKHLGVDPGSVSILGLVNDTSGSVEVVMDENLWHAKAIQCHPLVNTSTLVISKEHIDRFLEVTGHEAKVIDVPGRNELEC